MGSHHILQTRRPWLGRQLTKWQAPGKLSRGNWPTARFLWPTVYNQSTSGIGEKSSPRGAAGWDEQVIMYTVSQKNDITKQRDTRPGAMDGCPRISKLGTFFSAAIQGGTATE